MGGGGGGKGGSQVQSIKLDPRLEEGAVQTLAAGLRSAALPYRANRGVSISAFSPQQMAAFEGASSAASAFGLPTAPSGGYLPQPEQGAGGVYGYSPAALFDENVAKSMSADDIRARNLLLESYADAGDKVAKDKKSKSSRTSSFSKAVKNAIYSEPGSPATPSGAGSKGSLKLGGAK